MFSHMSAQLLAERVSEMIPGYEKMFAERGGVTPTEPLRFHLYHLFLYWSRLVGFCRQLPTKPETVIDTDLGACVQVGSEFAHRLIDPASTVFDLWQDYWKRAQAVLHDRPVTLHNVEEASKAFNACLANLNYDPLG